MFGRATITLGIGPHSSLLFFSRSNLRGRRTPPRGTLQDVGMWCNFITQIILRGENLQIVGDF